MTHILALMFALVVGASAPSPVSFAQDAGAFYDASAKATIETVVRDPARFAPASRLPSFPESNTPAVYWFRLRLARDASVTPWTLRFSYKVTQVDVYVPQGGTFVHVGGGFDLGARDETLVPGILVLPEPALRGVPFYVRVAAVIDPRSIALVPIPNALATPLLRRIIFGFLVGFFVAIGSFNLLMFLTLRDRALVNFACVLFVGAIRVAVSFGVFWQWLPPLTFLQRELIFDTVAMAGAVALGLFSIDFLKMTVRDRAAIPVVVGGMIVQLSVYVTDFFPNTTVAWDWTLLVTLAYYATLIYAGVRAYRGGMRVARIYTAGIAATVAGYVVNMNSYLLPHQELWVYSLEAATALQAILLGLAVAENVQESRAEHEALVMESRHLEQLAMRDGLTNVLNRRSFDAALRELAANADEQRSIGILMIDIDHFKDYNDTRGHQAGDEALRLVARACGACVRAGDIFARYGGEEFAAIVPGATAEELYAIAARMRDSVLALGLERVDGSALTISIGGATKNSERQSAEQILRAADAALYRAKSDGRDRAVFAGLAGAVSPLDAFWS